MTTVSEPVTAARKGRHRASTTPKKPQNPVAAKVNPMLIAAAIALIIVGALAAWYVLNAQSTTSTVVTVNTDIPRGAAISEHDLGTLDVADTAASSYVLAADATDLVGRTALADLTAGTPLTLTNTGTLTASGDEAIVGVPLTAAQMPATAITAGDTVSVVATAGSNAEAGIAPISIDAQVFSIRENTESGLTIVDLTLAPDDARSVAALAAGGNIALVLLQAGEQS